MNIELSPPDRLSSEDLAAWRALLATDPRLDSPFLTPDWALAVAEAQRGHASGVRVARWATAPGEQAFFTARLRGRTAMPVGAPMCDYQGLVARPGSRIEGRALLEGLKVDRLDFSHMLADQPSFAPYLRGRDLSHRVDLSEGHAAYLAERRGQTGLFSDLAKRRRKAVRELGEVRFEAYSRSRTAFEQLITWKQALMRATGQTDIFEAGWPRRLLEDLFASRNPDFGGSLFTLSIGDRLAAAHLHLRSRHTIHAWIIGHDHGLDRYSPGLLLFQDLLQWMDATPYRLLDFGPGDYRFKHQFSNAGADIGHGFIGRPASPASLVRAAQYGVRAMAENLPLGEISALPGKAMRRLDLWRGLN